jgi:hypothetical protein
MGGDFNMVEDAIDRLPTHADQYSQVEALDELKSELNLKDGWRDTYPTTKAYTFHQTATGSQSRIDRFYVTPLVLATAREWKIETIGVSTDHKMISVQVASENAPDVGKGRWSIPKNIIKDRTLAKYIHEQGMNALSELETLGVRTEENNSQTVYAKFKRKILEMARHREKIAVPKMELKKRNLENALERVNNDGSLQDDEKIKASAEITTKIANLEKSRHLKVRTAVATRNRIEGETVCAHWCRSNKEAKPRDMIYALRKPAEHGADPNAPAQYEKNSQRMAEMARDYHEALQSQVDGDQPTEEDREQKIKQVLENISTKLTDEQFDSMRNQLAEIDIAEALKVSKNNKAAGLDGATYELWKAIHARYLEDVRCDRPAFNLVGLMTKAFNDIEAFGVVPSTNFSEGWMCPIYKKNDRNEIANYRPITLLNSDYKIMTKALAIKLAKAAPTLIHKNQAGFIPGRKISDQTMLVRTMLDYAEATEKNGLIVALDQEKAYDKVAHDYLWRTLEAFGIPKEFINTVKGLYRTAETRVAINGHLSSRFRVTRGVRQGDPMSCILFNLAIEPMAAALRNSTLRGYMIPGSEEKLVVNLFADDTTTFLAADDDFETLQTILKDWCIAAKAKFNTAKTEIIPIGAREYRVRVIADRKTNNIHGEIPEEMHIVEEGNSVRILGAWFGNDANAAQPWAPVLEKIDAALENWNHSRPTMQGRRHIVQMVVGGMTQYLTQVQRMPKDIEKRLTKRIRHYMWKDEERGAVNEQTILAPIEEGGLGVLDLEARNQAIDIMWLKAYLNLGPDRALWGHVTDATFATKVPQSENKEYEKVRINPFLQSWKTSCGPKSDIKPELKSLLNTAKTFQVRPEGIAFSREILRKMPIWFHGEADKAIRRQNAQTTSKCLRDKHKVLLVEDAEIVARCAQVFAHQDQDDCNCDNCTECRDTLGCDYPNACYMKATQLLDCLPYKWDPRKPQPEDYEVAESAEPDDDGWVIFDRTVSVTGTLAEIFRIFTEGEVTNEVPDMRLNDNFAVEETVATDGSCFKNGCDDANAGAGIFYEEEDPRNQAIRLPETLEQSNQSAEMVALKEAVQNANADADLRIESDSKYVINAVTKNRQKMEDQGYIGVANKRLAQATVVTL